jgi:hypothetical protein
MYTADLFGLQKQLPFRLLLRRGDVDPSAGTHPMLRKWTAVSEATF